MRVLVRVVLAGLVCVLAAGSVFWLVKKRTGQGPLPSQPSASSGKSERAVSKEIFIDFAHFEDGGLGVAAPFTGVVRDHSSLKELREAIEARRVVGLATLQAEVAGSRPQAGAPAQQAAYAAQMLKSLGLMQMYAGEMERADASFAEAAAIGDASGASRESLAELTALRGIAAFRLGEADNCIACVGPSSCIFPISPQGAHRVQAGSRKALAHFTKYLEEIPGDLRVRWLLNLAYMTLNEYPDKVPGEFLIPIDRTDSQKGVVPFENVAVAAGLTSRGPNQAGGSVFDDFNGDGRPDLLSTSLDVDRGPSVYINKGDGTFEDRSDASGLADQVYALNLARGDYDNDGDLDVVLLRGGWESPMRMSLLRNKGDATFEDVTASAGLDEPVSSETAAWADFDNDGKLDLFVGAEFLPPQGRTPGFTADPRNHARLYHNNGDGTFTDVAARLGLVNEQCAKGSAWGDYDGDGFPDLYISNMNGPGRLYHNEAGRRFRDVAADLGVTGPDRGFACWFWDFDNDGKLDLFVNDYTYTLAETVAHELKIPNSRSSRPRLYRNLGAEGFREVSREVGLDMPTVPMGCNFGDIDNDGFLDFYLGTGVMSYEYLVPNRMFQNVGGKQFLDVSLESRTGHLQKGHGVSFADYDDDGDLDFFVEAGGGVPGDRSHNLLFRNPGNKRHALKVRLVGTASNRSALGATLKAIVKGPDGTTRNVHRTIGNNSSFGGNSLVELIGLGDAGSVSELVVTWPRTGKTQTFRDLRADQSVEITEGADQVKVLRGTSRVEERPTPGK